MKQNDLTRRALQLSRETSEALLVMAEPHRYPYDEVTRYAARRVLAARGYIFDRGRVVGTRPGSLAADECKHATLKPREQTEVGDRVEIQHTDGEEPFVGVVIRRKEDRIVVQTKRFTLGSVPLRFVIRNFGKEA